MVHDRIGHFIQALLAALALMIGVVMSANAQPVTLDVTFKLTDLENRPLPNVPARLVFGSDPDWRGAATGKRFVTDAKGEAHFTANVTFDQKLRKVPTNFVG